MLPASIRRLRPDIFVMALMATVALATMPPCRGTGAIPLVVYTAFSASVTHGIWHRLPPAVLVMLLLTVAALLAIALLLTSVCARSCGLARADEVTLVFCGSQKSLVAGIPIANALFAGPMLGMLVLPIMLYHPMQLIAGAWLARRYAKRQVADAAGVRTIAPKGCIVRAGAVA